MDTREIIAYALIAMVSVTAAVTYLVTRRRRRQEKLRRRGIKSYNS